MVGTHGSQTIMLVQQKNVAGRAIGGGVEAGGKSRNLSPQQRKMMERYGRNTRDALEPIEPHFSASSTVKIDINSQKDDTKENSPRGVFKHKIIPPESQMGQVYQKQNRALHQRGSRSNIKVQYHSPRGSNRLGHGNAATAGLIDFNSRLNFDKDSGIDQA